MKIQYAVHCWSNDPKNIAHRYAVIIFETRAEAETYRDRYHIAQSGYAQVREQEYIPPPEPDYNWRSLKKGLPIIAGSSQFAVSYGKRKR